MDTVNTNIFVDEVQIDKDDKKRLSLSLYYFGVCLNVYQGLDIEKQIKEVLDKYKIAIFHAQELYNKPTLKYNLVEDISKIILNNNVKHICFNFKKEDLDNPKFNVIKNINFTHWKLPTNNFRAVSFYFFIHVLNKFLPLQKELTPKYRIIKHEDQWLKSGRGLKPGKNGVLKNIEVIKSFKSRNAPCLMLSDHLCYLFGKCRRELRVDSNEKINFEIKNGQSMFLKICLEHLKLFSKKGLFIYKDTNDLIEYEY